MIERHLKKQIVKRYSASRSVYVFGPRQSGKTTLSCNTFPDLPYINLEDPDSLEYFTSDPRGFFASLKDGAVIDEPQRSPDLFSYLQGQIDQEKKKFILTSSQNFLTMESISQSLAGRISILTLLPLSQHEIQGKPLISFEQLLAFRKDKNEKSAAQINAIWPSILKGGYPEVHLNPDVFSYWYSDYIKTYLERDVRRIINVQNLTVFQRFLKLCAGRTGSVLNKASLASDCGISESNCVRWLSLLEQSGIIILLQPFYKNFNKRLIKSPKLIFVDTGLCAYLLGIKTVDHLSMHPLMGSIVETFVITEIYKNFLNRAVDPKFYYWRDQHGHEIDLLIEADDGKIVPIEIKAGQTITSKMTDSLKKWCALSGEKRGFLLYGGAEHQSRNNIEVLPIGVLV